MRVLWDTHVFIDAMRADADGAQRIAIATDEASDHLLSVATFWEIEIKRAKRKLDVPRDTIAAAKSGGFSILWIDEDHAVAAGRLPLHHGDPFDRMLVAQAQIEGLTLATTDAKLGAYDVPILNLTT